MGMDFTTPDYSLPNRKILSKHISKLSHYNPNSMGGDESRNNSTFYSKMNESVLYEGHHNQADVQSITNQIN